MDQLKLKGGKIDIPFGETAGSKVPSYVKCCVCGKPPVGADWLKPVNPDPTCRRYIHLSHIENGPALSAQAGFILRNA